jgi:hypothetical protein
LELGNSVAVKESAHDFSGFCEWVAGIWVASGVVVVGSPANESIVEGQEGKGGRFQ